MEISSQLLEFSSGIKSKDINYSWDVDKELESIISIILWEDDVEV